MTLLAPGALTGRTALVTGTSGGIGLAIARALAATGADVVGWQRGPSDHDSEFEVVHGDLSDASASQQVMRELLGRRRIDILVNNAGVIDRAPATEITLDSWRDLLAVNLDSIFALTQLAGQEMIERGSGAVVNVASLLSFQGGINVAGYAASKHGVVGLTKALSNEWSRSGVRVNAVAPGYVVTQNTEPLRGDDQRREEITARIPIGRWAEPQDIADPVVFLCSPAARYITGQTLLVDGGWMAR